MAGVRQAGQPPQVAALYLWHLRSALYAYALRLALVAFPPKGSRLPYLPRATRRRLYARATRVPRDRACALTGLARLSKAVGITDPSAL
ncbi:hypothetical protein [Streptomyces halobius]|uniref:Uncharacterized protein n=1 Tax=Streptomyces halobius TaxID=2879846 RepID=A0ABY4MCX1_9ACTN|nr:hypothetical protein [Streptomyces halobius]UQA94948.1 hypothetical protein K9S39_26585 [Streptomyces halobius]